MTTAQQKSHEAFLQWTDYRNRYEPDGVINNKTEVPPLFRQERSDDVPSKFEYRSLGAS
jgi:alpha-L-fucosidase